MRKFFHWQFSGALIPLFVGLAATMITAAIGQDSQEIIHGLFIFGNISLFASLVWAVGYWVTLDSCLGYIERGPSNLSRIGRFILTALPICLFYFILFLVSYRLETIRSLSTFSGVLTPAQDALLPICLDETGGISIALANNTGLYVKHIPFTILSLNGKPMVTLDTHSNGNIGITAKIFNREGKIIADVLEGAFDVNRNLVFKLERPDYHTLQIKDDSDEVVLYIRYNNQRQMTFLAKLSYPGVGPVNVFNSTENLCFVFPQKGTSYMNFNSH